MRLAALLLLLLAATLPAAADSPLTSTRFAETYLDVPMVWLADTRGVLTPALAEYLADPLVPIDARAAACNALGWDIDGKYNAELFRGWLALRYGVRHTAVGPDLLTADELFVLGYLTALDDYFHPEQALPYLQAAQQRNPSSLTVALITLLAEAQADLGSNRSARIWPRTEALLRDPSLRRGLRPAALTAIVNYLVLYRAEAAVDTDTPSSVAPVTTTSTN